MSLNKRTTLASLLVSTMLQVTFTSANPVPLPQDDTPNFKTMAEWQGVDWEAYET